MHCLVFWRAFANALCRAFDITLSALSTLPDLREALTWGGAALARRSFRNAFAACWDMLDGHPGDRVRERWELDD